MGGKEKKKINFDLIKTIDDNEEIADLSEDSDVEVEYQPSKVKQKKKVDFDSKFKFVSSVSEYQKDTWDDLMSFVKHKNRGKVTDKIANVIASRKEDSKKILEEDVKDEKSDEEIDLSDDELKHDNLRVKQKKGKTKVDSTIEDVLDKDFFEDAPQSDDITSFYQMNLSRPLMRAIGLLGYVHPTPIQCATIPVALLGRDICGCAATGTGKTASYMLPTLERLLYKPVTTESVTRVLVLVPTRELGAQVYQVTKQLCQFTNIDIGMAIGGLDVKAQEAILRKNPDVVIATPGRLIDHIKNTPSFTLDSIEVLILDEADRMLDEYFAAQMKEIIKSCSPTRQTMLFSATMTDEVKDLVAVSLTKPVKIFVNNNQTVAFNLRQEFIRIREDREDDREPILAALVCRTFHDHCMVFVQTKKAAHRLRILLGLLGLKSGELHGDLTQQQRLESLRQFKDEQIDILIATDVAARGLDISGVKTVINFVMPISVEHYIHRVGRTARAGKAGISVSLAGETERKMVKEIIKRATNPVKNRIIPSEIVEKYRKKVQALEPEIEKVLEEEKAEKMLAQAEQQLNKTEKKLKEELEAGKKNAQQTVPRQWFQSHKERMLEKERLSLKTDEDEDQTNGKPKKKNDKKPASKKRKRDDDGSDLEDNFFKKRKQQGAPMKKSKPSKTNSDAGKTPKELAKERAQKELEMASLTRAKLMKCKHKVRRLKAVVDEIPNENSSKKKNFKRKSKFAMDLADTSQKNVKKLRYDANKQKKIDEKVTKLSKVKLQNKAGLNKKNKGKHFGAPKVKKDKFKGKK
ncbi:probable ATP-dependent RNA helicase DDX27 [Culicoides brevitarsis]|uniref:probable ATP-dependent RNA helicase DDX27 n=1 Tax=Culicoides brevitarsis TaxID=469753 RepID=UPI00307C4D06